MTPKNSTLNIVFVCKSIITQGGDDDLCL